MTGPSLDPRARVFRISALGHRVVSAMICEVDEPMVEYRVQRLRTRRRLWVCDPDHRARPPRSEGAEHVILNPGLALAGGALVVLECRTMAGARIADRPNPLRGWLGSEGAVDRLWCRHHGATFHRHRSLWKDRKSV